MDHMCRLRNRFSAGRTRSVGMGKELYSTFLAWVMPQQLGEKVPGYDPDWLHNFRQIAELPGFLPLFSLPKKEDLGQCRGGQV